MTEVLLDASLQQSPTPARWAVAFRNFESLANALRNKKHPIFGKCGLKRIIFEYKKLQSAFHRHGCTSGIRAGFAALYGRLCAVRELHREQREEVIYLNFLESVSICLKHGINLAHSAEETVCAKALSYVQGLIECGVAVARRGVLEKNCQFIRTARVFNLNILVVLCCIIMEYWLIDRAEAGPVSNCPTRANFVAMLLIYSECVRKAIIHGAAPNQVVIPPSSIFELAHWSQVTIEGFLAEARGGQIDSPRRVQCYWIADFIGEVANMAARQGMQL